MCRDYVRHLDVAPQLEADTYVCMYIRLDDRLPSDRHVRSDSQLRRTRRRTMSCIPASSTRGLSDRLDRCRSLDLCELRRSATRACFHSVLSSTDMSCDETRVPWGPRVFIPELLLRLLRLRREWDLSWSLWFVKKKNSAFSHRQVWDFISNICKNAEHYWEENMKSYVSQRISM